MPDAVEVILRTIASADSDDMIGSIKVDIPAGGYPRQYIRTAASRILHEGNIILDLCGGTGAWSEPYRRAGYDVRVIDPIAGTGYVEDYHPPADVWGILAAPPCTQFAGSGARWKWTHHRTEFLLRQALQTVYHCLRIIGEARPDWWALENPVGTLRRYIGPWRYTFQPSDYGDPWTKRTCIWGEHAEPVRTSVEPTEGSKLWRLPPGPERQALRSETPPGYARAFYLANP